VRGAWISFVGRIIAQFVGSAASIVLGLALIERHHAAVTAAQTATVPTAAVAPAPALPGPAVLVVPLQSVAPDQQQLLVDQLAAAIKAAVGENASVAVVPRIPDGTTNTTPPGRQPTPPGKAGRRAEGPSVEGSLARTVGGPTGVHR
jgi:hypothetical protein